MTKRKLIGGSFAPKLTAEQLDRYATLAETLDDDNGIQAQCKGYMRDLDKMMRVFWETGDSNAKPQETPLGIAVTPLEPGEVDRIFDVVPWPAECDVIGQAFETLPSGELRNAAFHLLWYARELSIDREPTTTDRLNLV